jgi:hypothetical protein
MTSPSASNVSGVDGQVFHHTTSEACLPTSPPVPSQPTTFGSHSAPPQFVKPLSDLTVTEGNKVTLDCRLSTSVLPDRIQWYCKGVELFSSPDYTIAPCVGGMCSLTIAEVFPEDSGNYSCVATYSSGSTVSTSMNLKVTDPMETTPQPSRPPVIESRLMNQCLRVGQTASFECRVSGSPPPAVIWMRGGQPLLDKTRYKSWYDQFSGNVTLYILKTRDEDEGEYTCKALNTAGEAATSAFLLHQEHYSDWQRQNTASSQGLPPSALSLVSPSVSSVHGLVLSTPAGGDPATQTPVSPTVRRLLISTPTDDAHRPINSTATSPKEVPLLDQQVHKAATSRSRTHLLPTEPDKAVVTLVTNGSDSKQQTVSSPVKPGLQPVASLKNDHVLEPSVRPIFRKVPSNMEVTEGQTMRLDGIVTGRPNPEISWYRNGVAVFNDKSHKIVVNQDGISSLIFQPASLSDCGMYRCVARNNSGEDSFVVSVVVLARETQMVPRFTVRIANQTVSEGASVRLTAEAVGVPIPTLTWSKDGRQLPAPGGGGDSFHRIETDGGWTTLVIDKAVTGNTGWYQCAAVNTAGTATCRGKLTVQGASLPERNTTATPDWMRNIPRHVAASSGQPTVSRLENRRLSEPVKVSRGAPVVIPEASQMSHLERVLSPTRPQALWPPDKSLTKATDHLPSTRPTDSSVAYHKPCIDKPLEALMVVEGEPAKFVVKVNGEPLPTITWFINGVAVFNSTRFQVGCCGLMHMLEIKKTHHSDSGTVRVIAKNSHGEVDCSTSLTVSKHNDLLSNLKHAPMCTESPPQFVEQLSDVRVIDGQEVMLFCIVNGQPMPTVSWFHNNQNIDSNDEYVFTYDRRTGHAYLVILDCLQDDEGLFQCIATNSAGQAVTQCNLTVLPKDSKSQLPKPGVTSKTMTMTSTDDINALFKENKDWLASKSAITLLPSVNSGGQKTVSSSHDVKSGPSCNLGTAPAKKVSCYRTVLRRASDNDVSIYRGDVVMGQAAKDRLQPLNALSRTELPGQTLNKTTSSGNLSVGQSTLITTIPRSTSLSLVPGGQLNQPFQATSSRAFPSTSVTTKAAESFVSKTSFKSSAYKLKPTSETPVMVGHSERRKILPLSGLLEPPRFTLPLADQVVKDGSVALLRVSFLGCPTPKLTWYFNHKAIVDEQDFVIRTDTLKGESTLLIKEVFPEDAGEYVCKAESQCGTAVTHCRFVVQSPVDSCVQNISIKSVLPASPLSAGGSQLAPGRTGRRFSETISVDDSHRLHTFNRQPLLSTKTEKSELLVRRDSLPKPTRIEVQIERPEANIRTQCMELKVPAEFLHRRFSETVALDHSARHRSELEFQLGYYLAAVGNCLLVQKCMFHCWKPSSNLVLESHKQIYGKRNLTLSQTPVNRYHVNLHRKMAVHLISSKH